MKFARHLHPGFGQFRWVVLLLAVAVILPTVCLLWFMNAMVGSERLAVRQRLTTFYKGRLAEVTARIGSQWSDPRCWPRSWQVIKTMLGRDMSILHNDIN